MFPWDLIYTMSSEQLAVLSAGGTVPVAMADDVSIPSTYIDYPMSKPQPAPSPCICHATEGEPHTRQCWALRHAPETAT